MQEIAAPSRLKRMALGIRARAFHSSADYNSRVLVPNAERATIDPAKLRDYLLSTTHPIGRFKARFFRSLGFVAERSEEFAEALRIQHLTQDAEAGPSTANGRKYVIRAILVGPTGQSATVVSVWFVPAGGEVPRFVTAYPGGAR